MLKMIPLGAAALLAVTATWTVPAFALVPVADQAVITASNQIATATDQQLSRLNDIKKTTGDILSSLGTTGQGQYDLSKNTSWKDFTNGGDLLKGLQQFGPNTCAPTGCATSSSQSGSQNFTDIASAKKYIMQNLYSSSVVSRTDQANYATARKNVQRDANVTGYALALFARQYLAKSADRAQKLENIVNGSSDLRGDIHANSAVTLDQDHQLIAMLAVLTSMLERDSTSFIADSDREIVAKDGGTTPPNAYNPKDYLPDGTRVGVDGQSIDGASSSSSSGGSSSLESALSGSSSTSSSLGNSPLLAAASASGNGQVSQLFQNASTTYGSSGISTAFGAASAAAGLDGNATLQSTYATVAQTASAPGSGSLSSVLYNSAMSSGASSDNEQLQWLYKSSSYAASNGGYSTLVGASGSQQPLINAMFNVAQSMNTSDTGRSALYAAQSALSNGTMTQQEAAGIALQVASTAAGRSDLTNLLRGAQSAASGASASQVAAQVINGYGSNGQATSAVANVLSSTNW